MSVSLAFDGMKELRAALEVLPAALRDKHLPPTVAAEAEAMAAEVRAGYPLGETGNLRAGVVTEKGRTSSLVMKVRSKAPHAHLFEFGTVSRYTRRTGAHRGKMPEPAQPNFVPAAIRSRVRLVARVKAVMSGLQMPGFSGSLAVKE